MRTVHLLWLIAQNPHVSQATHTHTHTHPTTLSHKHSVVSRRGRRFAFVTYAHQRDALRAKEGLVKQQMWRSNISFAKVWW